MNISEHYPVTEYTLRFRVRCRYLCQRCPIPFWASVSGTVWQRTIALDGPAAEVRFGLDAGELAGRIKIPLIPIDECEDAFAVDDLMLDSLVLETWERQREYELSDQEVEHICDQLIKIATSPN